MQIGKKEDFHLTKVNVTVVLTACWATTWLVEMLNSLKRSWEFDSSAPIYVLLRTSGLLYFVYQNLGEMAIHEGGWQRVFL